MITWTCEQCGRPIVEGTGYVIIDRCGAREHEDLTAEVPEGLQSKSPLPGGAMTMTSGLDEFPEHVLWEAVHRACDPEPERCDYWIATEKLRTPAAVLRFTGHLSGSP